MLNWFEEKEEIKKKLICGVMGELEILLSTNQNFAISSSANYWLDNSHNVFAFINYNSDEDQWIEIHYELYNFSGEDIIGDLHVGMTDDLIYDELVTEVETIVNMYLGE